MKSYEECCEECQELNPFFRLGGGVVGRFAYPRNTPFIQPFESIESPWADFIKSDSLETNIKKLYKLAQKYGKETTEEKKAEEKKAEEEVEVKPKLARKERAKSAPRPRAKGKEKIIDVYDYQEEKEERQETQGVLTRTQRFEQLKSNWKSLNALNRLNRSQKDDILIIAGAAGVFTEQNTPFLNVDRRLYDKMNEKFGTNFTVKKTSFKVGR